MFPAVRFWGCVFDCIGSYRPRALDIGVAGKPCEWTEPMEENPVRYSSLDFLGSRPVNRTVGDQPGAQPGSLCIAMAYRNLFAGG